MYTCVHAVLITMCVCMPCKAKTGAEVVVAQVVVARVSTEAEVAKGRCNILRAVQTHI